MARARATAVRFDHRGGLNLAVSPELLDETELVELTNARIVDGALVKRTGSRRVHDTALASGAAVVGLTQWDAPAGAQVIAKAGTTLYQKLAAATSFTSIGTGLASGVRPRFATHRIGTSIVLYVADGTLRKWDGTTLSTISGAPAARDLAVYKRRMFAANGTKTLTASKIGDPADWNTASGVSSGALAQDVETFDTEGIVRIGVVGSSLAICKANNIARFTGTDADDIQIDAQTEGISPDVGLIAPGTFIPVESVWFGLSDRGPWILTEAGLEFVGDRLLPAFDAADHSAWANAVAVHHPARREVWLWLPPAGATTNTRAYIWSYRTRTWSGPVAGTVAQAVARYERTDGTETILRGGADGFVREEDVAALYVDDQLRTTSGGTAVSFAAEYPPFHFGDPGLVKRLVGEQRVQAALAVAQTLTIRWTNEAGDTGTATVTGAGGAMRDYPFRIPRAKGKRVRVRLEETSASPLTIGGLVLSATVER